MVNRGARYHLKSDPRGACRTCHHFIDDPSELAAEMKFVTQGGVYIPTAERVLGPHGIAVGEALRRVEHNYEQMAHAFARLGIAPEDVGLCEVGVARFVSRWAGATTACKPCPKWKEKSPVIALRPPDWRRARDANLHAAKTRE